MPPKKNIKTVAKSAKPVKPTKSIPAKKAVVKKNQEEEESDDDYTDENSLSDEVEDEEEDLDKSDSIDYSDEEDDLDDDESDDEGDSDKSDDENFETLEYIIDVRETDKSERIILTGTQRQMTDRVTPAELAIIVSVRAAQIEQDPVCFAEIDNIDTPQAIAVKELKKRTCPFKIIRHSHSNIYEEWKVNEMKIPWNSTGMMNIK